MPMMMTKDGLIHYLVGPRPLDPDVWVKWRNKRKPCAYVTGTRSSITKMRANAIKRCGAVFPKDLKAVNINLKYPWIDRYRITFASYYGPEITDHNVYGLYRKKWARRKICYVEIICAEHGIKPVFTGGERDV